MPIKYVFSLLLVFTLCIFTPPSQVNAADLDFICNKSCVLVPKKPLFEEQNIKPGDYFVKTIKVTNLRKEPCKIDLSLNNPYESNNSLSCNLLTNISSTGLILGAPFSSSSPQTTLKHLYLTKDITLGNIGASSKKLYRWAILFNPYATNTEQSQNTRFNFNLTMTCENDEYSGSVLGLNTKSLLAIPITNYCDIENTDTNVYTNQILSVKDSKTSLVGQSRSSLEKGVDTDQDTKISFFTKIVQYILFYLQLVLEKLSQFFD